MNIEDLLISWILENISQDFDNLYDFTFFLFLIYYEKFNKFYCINFFTACEKLNYL